MVASRLQLLLAWADAHSNTAKDFLVQMNGIIFFVYVHMTVASRGIIILVWEAIYPSGTGLNLT